jgi:hypothetical protein
MPVRMGMWGLGFVAILLWVAVCVPVLASAQIDLIGDVRSQLAQNSFSAAESELRTYYYCVISVIPPLRFK